MAALGSTLASFGESLAVVDRDGEQSYLALDGAANAVAAALVDAGVRPGSVVATVCPAGRWWLAGTYGINTPETRSQHVEERDAALSAMGHGAQGRCSCRLRYRIQLPNFVIP